MTRILRPVDAGCGEDGMHFWITLFWVVVGVVVAIALMWTFWRPIVEKVRSWAGNEERKTEAASPAPEFSELKAEPAKAATELTPPTPQTRTSDLGQKLRAYAQMQKIASGKVSLVFSEAVLAKGLGHESWRIQEVLELLEKRGHARKSAPTGYWTIS